MKKDIKSSLKNWFANYGRLTLLLIAVTLVVFGIARWINAYIQPNPQRKTEVWIPYEENTMNYDLTEIDFSENVVARLDLNLLYYPSLLLTPETVDSIEPTQMVPGNTLDEYVTQRWILQMPEGNRAYKIYFYHVRYATLAYINGAFAGQSGQPADHVDGIVVGRAPLVVYGTADENGQMDIILQTASFLHWEDPAFLGELWISRADYNYELPIGEIGSGYLMVGVLLGFVALLIGMFIAFPKQTGNLYFAAACFLMAVRSGVEGDAMTKVLSFMSPNIVYILFHMSVPLLTFFFMMYLHKTFPGMVPRWSRWAIGLVTAAFVITCLVTEPVFYTGLRKYYQIITEVGMIVFSVRLIAKLRKPTAEQAVSLFGIILFFIAVNYDMARYLNLFRMLRFPADLTNAFMLVFVLTQMVALFLGNSRAAVEAQEAARRIAAEKEAVERINELKTEFLANVSHELKTPLTVMSGHAQHGQKTLQAIPEAEEAERGMKLIASEADRLALMVGQVLDVSQIDEGRMALHIQATSISELIQNAMETYYPMFSKNNNALCIAPAALPDVNCDAARVTQVLINLVSNAARHTRDGSITVKAEQDGDMARISVIDTGEGIPPEEMAALFERYRKKKAPGDTGAGLGLYISKHIVEAHGGQLTIESEAGKGATASFTLPLS